MRPSIRPFIEAINEGRGTRARDNNLFISLFFFLLFASRSTHSLFFFFYFVFRRYFMSLKKGTKPGTACALEYRIPHEEHTLNLRRIFAFNYIV